MFGIIILFSNVLADTFNALMQRYFAKTFSKHKFSAYLLVNIFFFYPVGVLYSVIHRDKVNFAPILQNDWHLLLLIGLTAGITYRYTMVVNEKIEASTQQIIGTLRTVGILAIAALFLAERLTPSQYIGAFILILSSILYVQTKRLDKNKSYIILQVVITLLFCACLVTEKYLISKYGIATYLPLGWGMEVLFLSILSSGVAIKEVRKNRYTKATLKALIMMGVFDACASLTYVLSINAWQSVSLVNTVRIIQAPLTVFLAIFILREKDQWGRKTIAITVASIGLWLIL